MLWQRHDVVVVGAGLAGLQCARRLARAGVDVLLVDAKETPADAVSTTGIFVRHTLEDFPLPSDCFAGSVQDVVLHSPHGRQLPLHSQEPEFRIADMPRLYSWLLRDALEHGARWAPGHRYVFCEPLGDGNILRFQTRDGSRYVQCRMVVGADGARSHVARDLNLSRNQQFLVGTESVSACRNVPSDIFHCFLDPVLAPGYLGWIVAAGDEVHIGVAGYADRVRADSALAQLTDKARALGIEPQGTAAERRTGFIPVGGILPNISSPRGVLVGDAAGAVSPLTAGGFDTALRLSEFAATLIPECLAGNAAMALAAYDGQQFAARRVASPTMRWLFGALRRPQAMEWAFALLATVPLRPLAHHVFFGRNGIAGLGRLPMLQPTA